MRMKFRSYFLSFFAGLALVASAPAQDGVRNPPSDPIMVELKALVDEVTGKLRDTPDGGGT